MREKKKSSYVCAMALLLHNPNHTDIERARISVTEPRVTACYALAQNRLIGSFPTGTRLTIWYHFFLLHLKLHRHGSQITETSSGHTMKLLRHLLLLETSYTIFLQQGCSQSRLTAKLEAPWNMGFIYGNHALHSQEAVDSNDLGGPSGT